jgi:hypothetical protein
MSSSVPADTKTGHSERRAKHEHPAHGFLGKLEMTLFSVRTKSQPQHSYGEVFLWQKDTLFDLTLWGAYATLAVD